VSNVTELNPKCFRDYFKSQEEYEAYLKAEADLKHEPLNLGFDWKYFLKSLFGGQ
jgi:hypothetical protein